MLAATPILPAGRSAVALLLLTIVGCSSQPAAGDHPQTVEPADKEQLRLTVERLAQVRPELERLSAPGVASEDKTSVETSCTRTMSDGDDLGPSSPTAHRWWSGMDQQSVLRAPDKLKAQLLAGGWRPTTGSKSRDEYLKDFKGWTARARIRAVHEEVIGSGTDVSRIPSLVSLSVWPQGPHGCPWPDDVGHE